MLDSYDHDRDSRSGPGLKVALYLRQSDKEQRLSVGQQRKECIAYAQSRGWHVAAEYRDEGKSGSKEVEKRTDFLRMIHEAEQPGRQWQAVLTWDTSRFGRLDSQHGAAYKLRLRKVGVWLETAKGDSIDWTRSMDRVMDSLRAEQDHQYSLDLSKNVIRGRKAILDLGYSPRPAAYGFDRAYYDGDKLEVVKRRREAFSKPRNWHLIPQPNPEEANVVKWVFEQWATRDMTFGGTIKELRERGIPSPSDSPTWTLAQVKRLLTERMYVGDLHIGMRQKAKAVHYRVGEHVKKDAIPAIIDRKVFDRVQRKVKEREGGEWRPKTSSGPLSGVLKCGKCGHTLARRRYGGFNYYVCESATKRPHLGCRQWRVNEKVLMPVVTRELVDAVDWEVLEQAKARPPAADDAQVERLRKQEADLAAKVKFASKRILLLDPDNFKIAEEALSELRRDHERAANALKLATEEVSDDERFGWVQWWHQAKAAMVEMTPEAVTPLNGPADVDPKGYPWVSNGKLTFAEFEQDHEQHTISEVRPPLHATVDTFRDLLRRLNVEVHLWWECRNPEATTPRWRLSTGELRAMWRPGEGASTVPLEVLPVGDGTRARRRRPPVARPVRTRRPRRSLRKSA
jgi:DNA invertase Pin-like site-specific DNA recombinase